MKHLEKVLETELHFPIVSDRRRDCRRWAAPSEALGALNCGVFKKLKASQRNWSWCPSRILKFFVTPTSQVFNPGASRTKQPAVP